MGGEKDNLFPGPVASMEARGCYSARLSHSSALSYLSMRVSNGSGGAFARREVPMRTGALRFRLRAPQTAHRLPPLLDDR